MKINIYYGGRGLIEDSTIYVINKLIEVLEDLHVAVKRYNLYEEKNNITVLPNNVRECDGVILAVNVEWFGIGGYMQQFLDACWLYADKEKIKNCYMMPVVISNTYGEKENMISLIKAWETLGGIAAEGICAYVDNSTEFEADKNYAGIIENAAEDFYRIISRKGLRMPSSNYVVKKNILHPPLSLTPQESEQLSKYVSDDARIKKQKEDIEELASLYTNKLEISGTKPGFEYEKSLKKNFKPQGKNYRLFIVLHFKDTGKSLGLNIGPDSFDYIPDDSGEKADISATLNSEVLNRIINGRSTFQGAFMAGDISCKGDFKLIKSFDTVFPFELI